jgi:hypothetical protein
MSDFFIWRYLTTIIMAPNFQDNHDDASGDDDALSGAGIENEGEEESVEIELDEDESEELAADVAVAQCAYCNIINI